MELTVKERLLMAMIMPQEGSYQENLVKADIMKKIELSQEEMDTLEFKQGENGSVVWNREKELEKDFDFSSSEKDLLSGLFSKFDQERKITMDTMSLFSKIKKMY